MHKQQLSGQFLSFHDYEATNSSKPNDDEATMKHHGQQRHHGHVDRLGFR